ncbi:MAG: hypothetical protein COU27_02065 [Candidatus Levybacteria bacterium CG10_big_fil_rev_8_21_14_0_10_36_7]|nr:MAG: hypothetical protein COU27_02065 [Candidatus Levybacteria bacterium CG10_big_fil_rev_8_21_14_0_10_36_7]
MIKKSLAVIKKVLQKKPVLYVPLTPQHWDKQYKRGAWDSLIKTEYPNSVKIAQILISQVKPGEQILDYGCGNGGLVKDLNGHLKENYLGVDISQEAIKQARENHPGYQFLEVSELKKHPQKKIDHLVLCEVLYYVDYKKFLAEIQLRLKPNAQVIVSLYRAWRSTLIIQYLKKIMIFKETNKIKDPRTTWKVIIAKFK